MPNCSWIQQACVMALMLATLAAQSQQDPAANEQPPSTKPKSSETVWHSDFATARKLAEAQHAPLLVMFRCER